MKHINPMLCGWNDAPAEGRPFPVQPGMTYEIKWDGYRMQAVKVGDDVQLYYARSKAPGGGLVTKEFPEIVEAVRQIPVDCIIDGEAIVLRNGWPHFQDFQNRFALSKAERAERLRFIAFDVLRFGEVNAMSAPYSERRKALEALVAPASPVVFIGPSSTDGVKMWDFVMKHSLEGLIAKPLDSRYLPGERGTWRKIKRLVTEEFVVVGYSHATDGKREGWFGAVYMAQPIEDGKLRMVGPVGTGFNDAVLADLTRQMKAIERATAPENLCLEGQPTGIARTRMTYVDPVIWAKVTYSERTDDGWGLRGPASWKGQIDRA